MELVLTIAAFAFLILILLLLHRPQLRLPPGPRGMPLFGSLFEMRGMLRTPMRLQKLALDHGPIFTIHLGSIPLMLISSPAIAHEALIEKGSVFSSRPRSISRRQLLLSNHHRSINSATYGTHWRTARRNLVSHVLNPVRVNAFQSVRYRAVHRLLEVIRSQDRAVVLPVLPAVRFTVFSVLSYMCFGFWLEDCDVRRLEALLREIITSARGSLSDFVPLLRIFQLPFSRDERLEEMKAKRDGVLQPLIENSRRLAEAGKLDENSYFASLLKLQPELGLTDVDFVVLCSEFLNAGADTTANSLEWTLACMIKYPDVQLKVYQEINSQVGKTEVTEQDVERLVYLHAMVKETLRMHPPGYTTLPHAVTQPCKLAGYDIPTNASLLFNIYAINNDPELWECPSEFKPERFVGERGVHADYTASSGQLNLIPFGAGRRICPGLGLATLHIHYILARLVQEFEWSSDEAVDLTPKQEFTVVMKNPLRATVKVRT